MVTIRRQTVDDVDAVIDVLWTVGAEGRWIGTEVPFDRDARAERMRRLIDDPTAFAGFVATTDDGTIVGSIGLELARYGVAGIGMCLLDSHRGQGIGTRLLLSGIEWARGAGAHKLELQVWPHNEGAIALYKKVGFEEEGRLRQHYRRQSGELWDAIVMGLLL
jgi:RimJ/RimL family protein N-acetyltransferase